LRDEKLRVKEAINQNRGLINSIKVMHSEILALEEQIEYVASEIKKRKAAGMTAEESKRREESKRELIQN